MKLCALFFAFTLLPLATFAEEGDDPSGQYAGFSSNGFRLASIEYWGNGKYDGGNGVSFGYFSNTKEWNRACGRTAWKELKKTLELNTPEMQALREAKGPTGIYIIISDWTAHNEPDEQLQPAEVWHYNGDDKGRGGLIKFHGHAKLGADGKLLCHSPTQEQLIQFAIEAKRKIDESTARP